MAKRKKSQNENFFVRFWNGDLSLPMSYWVVGTGFGIAFAFLVGIFTISAGMSEHVNYIYMNGDALGKQLRC